MLPSLTSAPAATRRMQLSHYEPSKLIVLDSEHRRKVLSSSVNEATAEAYDQVPLPRSCFDDTSAFHYLVSRVSADERESMRTEDCRRYYMALSSAGALLNYSRAQSKTEPHNIRLRLTSPDTHLALDFSTLVSLELLQACQYHRQRNQHRKRASVLGAIDRTRTTGGRRLLKTSLVQPPRDLETIRARQDAVRELVARPELARAIADRVSAVPRDHEHICLQFATSFPSLKCDKGRWIQRTVSKLLSLRGLLRLLPSLARELSGARSLLLRAVGLALTQADVGDVLASLEGLLEEDDGDQSRRDAGVTHLCYLVKCEENGALDVARRELERVGEQAHDLEERYRKELGTGAVKLGFNPRRKFHLMVPKGGGDEVNLTGSFIPLPASATSRATACYTTLELNVVNSRLQTSLGDCFDILCGMIEGLTERVRGNITHLRVLAEAMSTLDLVVSFAELALEPKGEGYTCPDVEEGGPLLIVEGKHPLLAGESAEPNSTFLSRDRPLELVSGPNMAGKSTYSRQVALVAILAHAGSFVPAKYARVPLLAQVLTRSTVTRDSGSIEDNLSSFYAEMQDIARVTRALGTCPGASLVVVDEIGRSTSEADGEAIAWSVAEHLLSSAGAFTVFITHYDLLGRLPEKYPGCLHRAFSSARGSKHQLNEAGSGPDQGLSEKQYGIDLAEGIGYPEEVVAEARELSRAASLAKARPPQAPRDPGFRLKAQARDHLEVLSLLFAKGLLSEGALRAELLGIQQQLQRLTAATATATTQCTRS